MLSLDIWIHNTKFLYNSSIVYMYYVILQCTYMKLYIYIEISDTIYTKEKYNAVGYYICVMYPSSILLIIFFCPTSYVQFHICVTEYTHYEQH